MADHYTEFPFEEIRREDGNYFDSWAEAKAAGYDDDQIWSVTESDGTWTYGPPHHYVNHMGHVATLERHDGETYYHDEPEGSECPECGEIPYEPQPACPECGAA